MRARVAALGAAAFAVALGGCREVDLSLPTEALRLKAAERTWLKVS